LALSRGARVRGEPSELAVLGRLAHGMSAGQAQAELDLHAQAMEREIPAAKGWFNSRPVSMSRQLSGETRRPLLLLLGAVGIVLLIACSNVATLMLSRTISRTREIRVRSALGASRSRLVRHLMTESLLLAALGGAGGIVLANVGVSLVSALGPADVPRL